MAKILLIDDDNDFRKMLKTAIERAGHEVLEAPNGNVGYQVFEEQPCDLIITDIFMPEKEGIHTILDFKSVYPDVGIIAISGGGNMAKFVDEDDVLQMVNKSMECQLILELATDFGADEVVSKPLEVRSFLQTIDKMLESTGQSSPAN